MTHLRRVSFLKFWFRQDSDLVHLSNLWWLLKPTRTLRNNSTWNHIFRFKMFFLVNLGYRRGWARFGTLARLNEHFLKFWAKLNMPLLRKLKKSVSCLFTKNVLLTSLNLIADWLASKGVIVWLVGFVFFLFFLQFDSSLNN